MTNQANTLNGSCKPLAGLKVLELGHFIAAPHCTRLMADLGASIIKVEAPNSGDPIRSWGMMKDGNTLWWSVHGRGKQCITLTIRTQCPFWLA